MHAGVYCCYSVSAHSWGSRQRHAHQQWEQDLVACHPDSGCHYPVDGRVWTGCGVLWQKKRRVSISWYHLFYVCKFLLNNILRLFYFSLRVTVSGKKKLRQSTMHSVAKETSLGPVVAQSHLRDMARPPTVRPPTAVEPGNAGGQGNAGGRQQSVSGEALLEFQDLTDYNK